MWHVVGIVAGMAASALLLGLVLRGIPAALLWSRIRGVDAPMLLLAALAFAASNAARAWRWQLLLGGPRRARFRLVFASLMVGYFLNNLVPARLGELARIYLVERTTGISFGRTVGTVVVERMLEALVLVVAVGALAHGVPLPPALGAAARAATGGCALAAVVAVTVALCGHRWLRQVSRGSARGPAWRHRTVSALERFVQGLEALCRPRLAAPVAAISLLVWALEVLSVALTVQAMGMRLSWLGCAFLLSAVGMSFAVPAAPGGAGAYEAFALLALRPFGIVGPPALGLVLVSHALFYVTTAGLGLASVFVDGISLRDLGAWRPPAAERPVAPTISPQCRDERQLDKPPAGMM